jgi:hypothetical protein
MALQDAACQAGGSTRYIQAALATPAERKRRPRSLMVSYDLDMDGPPREQPPCDVHGDALPLEIYNSAYARGGKSGFCPPRRAAWSDHYKTRARDPSDVTPAPWVVDYYARKAPQRLALDVELDRERSEREKWRQLGRQKGDVRWPDVLSTRLSNTKRKKSSPAANGD